MNETKLSSDELRVSDEMNWIYTSSSRVAKVWGLPHEKVVDCILALVDELPEWGDGVPDEKLRYGLLTYHGQGIKDEFEILLSQYMFRLLATRLEGKAA